MKNFSLLSFLKTVIFLICISCTSLWLDVLSVFIMCEQKNEAKGRHKATCKAEMRRSFCSSGRNVGNCRTTLVLSSLR